MVSRRSFIKSALMGAAAASVSSPFSAFAIDPTGKVLGANDKIRIGMIGVNSRGKGIASGLAKYGFLLRDLY